ncbi:hypothetical protein K3495_g7442 [Podosphaera aphanis]|nr:hypothetical protein K3495_g7442 [Podosphaera aphanis]
MTSAGSYSKPIIYPDYCHYLSPTIGKWCPLWATDVRDLKTVGIFTDGGPLLHLGNHPVKWVRLTGVIVAVDTWAGPAAARKIYTLDDSSGACIACSAVLPAQDTAPGPGVPSVRTPCVPWAELQIGSVVKIKGRAIAWWAERRVEIVKAEVLRCTELEVKCWDEVREFRRDTLSRPWQLTHDEQRQCRRRKEKRKVLKQKQSLACTKTDRG